MGEVQVVGVDGATDNRKIGLAIGVFVDGQLRVDRGVPCAKVGSVSATVAKWIAEFRGPTLLAIDAPLGWPTLLSVALSAHHAGDEIAIPPDAMFRRETDRFVQQELGKTPLDVGADRIARTAHAALRLLGDLRRHLAQPISLAWSASSIGALAAIEVYPAATLIGHGLRPTEYKKANQISQRREILDGLGKLLRLPQDADPVLASADVLDAVVCLLAAADFLTGAAVPPTDRLRAQREGWIWSRGK